MGCSLGQSASLNEIHRKNSEPGFVVFCQDLHVQVVDFVVSKLELYSLLSETGFYKYIQLQLCKLRIQRACK